ncbi:Strictosidine synthase, conserved region, partial [Dillenia turbinata]
MVIIFKLRSVAILFLTIVLFSFPSIALSISSFQIFQLPSNVTGAEAFAFNTSNGDFYKGVFDGRILKYQESTNSFTDFAFTSPNRTKELCDGTTNPELGPICGRPLGLGFDRETGDMYIADAYIGLTIVGPQGGLATQLVNSAYGVPFQFLDSFDIDPITGVIYMTDYSSVYQLRYLYNPFHFHLAQINSEENGCQLFALSFFLSSFLMFRMIEQAIATRDATGRLLKYDPKTKEITVLLNCLSGAAGNAVSEDGSFVLVSENISGNVLKYWLKGSKANTTETFISYQGQPDNIKRTSNGEFWIAVNIQED